MYALCPDSKTVELLKIFTSYELELTSIGIYHRLDITAHDHYLGVVYIYIIKMSLKIEMYNPSFHPKLLPSLIDPDDYNLYQANYFCVHELNVSKKSQKGFKRHITDISIYANLTKLYLHKMNSPPSPCRCILKFKKSHCKSHLTSEKLYFVKIQCKYSEIESDNLKNVHVFIWVRMNMAILSSVVHW